MGDSKQKLEDGKWAHGKRVSHDKIIEGLKHLKAGLEDAVEEAEEQLKHHQQVLLNLSRPGSGKTK